MIVLNGRIYRIDADGRATANSLPTRTPFVVNKKFRAEKTQTFKKVSSFAELTQKLDHLLGRKKSPCAIVISGTFSAIKMRSIGKQGKPYPKLTVALKSQSIIGKENVKGTMVGFFMPNTLQGTNVGGYHFHFITEDLTEGGHVLDVSLREGIVQTDHSQSVVIHFK